jgi:hypothetical protein
MIVVVSLIVGEGVIVGVAVRVTVFVGSGVIVGIAAWVRAMAVCTALSEGAQALRKQKPHRSTIIAIFINPPFQKITLHDGHRNFDSIIHKKAAFTLKICRLE